ncbi:MBL fold metallo-hydrolase [Candidatus Gracilibacteria bacterium]|nr:MBL fold metallo-hydrolase [Candidatus Gracilibacteria bacterium]
MKIQFYGQNCFTISGKEASCAFDTPENFSQSVDVTMDSGNFSAKNIESKKNLSLPGEFEISGILVKGFYSDDQQKNIVYKIIIDDVCCVHLGDLQEIPHTKFFENLGENVDIAFVNFSESLNEKKVKDLLEKIEPRMVLLGGDESFFPKMVETCGAKTSEENPITVSKSSLSNDKTDIFIMNV